MAYLDVNKTGSTFVSAFLRDHLADEEVSFVKHGRIEAFPPKDRIHLITVRHPVDQYLSLFSYGCQGLGDVRNRLHARGWGDLYQPDQAGFRRWLDCVLDPTNAFVLSREYRISGCAPHAGLMSYRVARLAIPMSIIRLRLVRSPQGMVDVYRKYSVVDAVAHTESLASDLEGFLLDYQTQLQWRPSFEDALAALRAKQRVNASKRVDDSDGEAVYADDDVRAQIEKREMLLISEFGYGSKTPTDG